MERAVILHVKYSRKISPRRFQSWRWTAYWTPSKDWNGEIASTVGYKLCAHWKGAYRTAWRYAASRFPMITYDGKGRRKADRFRMNCQKTIKTYGMTLHSLCFKSSGKKIFCTKSLQAMKNGFFMIILNVENHGLTPVKLRHRRQSPISHAKKVLLRIW